MKTINKTNISSCGIQSVHRKSHMYIHKNADAKVEVLIDWFVNYYQSFCYWSKINVGALGGIILYGNVQTQNIGLVFFYYFKIIIKLN